MNFREIIATILMILGIINFMFSLFTHNDNGRIEYRINSAFDFIMGFLNLILDKLE